MVVGEEASLEVMDDDNLLDDASEEFDGWIEEVDPGRPVMEGAMDGEVETSSFCDFTPWKNTDARNVCMITLRNDMMSLG